MMRLLLFGSSGEEIGHDLPGGTALQRVCAGIEQHTGDTIEPRFAYLYPSAGTSAYVARQLEDFEPDIVLLHCGGHTVGEDSLERGLRRRFGGRLPRWLVLGRDSARGVLGFHFDPERENPPLTGLRPDFYRWLSAQLLLAGFGATLQTVEQTAAAYAGAIRTMVTHEIPICLVRGPGIAAYHLDNARLHRRALERMAALEARIQAACAERRVPFYSIQALTAANPTEDRGPDLIHRSAAGVALRAEQELQHLLPLLSP
jgi:hypothetical protein